MNRNQAPELKLQAVLQDMIANLETGQYIVCLLYYYFLDEVYYNTNEPIWTSSVIFDRVATHNIELEPDGITVDVLLTEEEVRTRIKISYDAIWMCYSPKLGPLAKLENSD